MSDNEKQFKIKLTTTADSSGVKQATEAVQGHTNSVGKNTDTQNEANRAEEKGTPAAAKAGS